MHGISRGESVSEKRRCRVALPLCPVELEFDAVDEGDAIAQFKTACGIIQTDHQFGVTWLDADGKPTGEEPTLADLGITEGTAAALAAANLTTRRMIVAYARQHGSLTSVPGIGPVAEAKIKKAVASSRGG
jgi:hypothetical protein